MKGGARIELTKKEIIRLMSILEVRLHNNREFFEKFSKDKEMDYFKAMVKNQENDKVILIKLKYFLRRIDNAT